MNDSRIFMALLILFFAVITASGAKAEWLLGQDRMSNGDFEGDEVGKPPAKWELIKGG